MLGEIGAHDFHYIAVTCAQIGDTGRNLSGALPGPTPQMDAELRAATNDVALAQQDCRSWAAPTVTGAQVDGFLAHMQGAMAHLRDATQNG